MHSSNPPHPSEPHKGDGGHWYRDLARRLRAVGPTLAHGARHNGRSRALLAIEHDDAWLRAAIFRRGQRSELLVEDLEEQPSCRGTERMEVVARLLRRSDAAPEHAILVTSIAGLRRTPEAGLVASLPAHEGERWSASLAGAGLALTAVYPFEGTAVAGLVWRDEDLPALCLQLERTSLSVCEVHERSCVSLDTVRGEVPTVRRALELVGEGCAEVFLCGGGVELSGFGCELAREGTAWVRVPALLASSADGRPLPPSLAASIGACRHALGLVPRAAVVCVHPHASSSEFRVLPWPLAHPGSNPERAHRAAE